MKITSVIVTYNRKDCLNKLLNIYDDLLDKPDNIVIVNNNSNDGTEELLNNWIKKKQDYSKYIVNTEQNLGGSGGFYLGIKKALELDSDWVYVSDDDAYPNNNVISIFKEFIQNNDVENIAAICGTVLNGGIIDIGHRRRIKRGTFRIKEFCVEENEYSETFELDLFSYVGTIINSKYLLRYGITEKDFFIYYDDTEHSLRLSKYGKILCIPNAVIQHNVANSNEKDIYWKGYYLERNKLITIKKHYASKYFFIEYLRNLLRIIQRYLKGKNQEANLIKRATQHARKNIQGMDKIYKPGMKLDD